MTSTTRSFPALLAAPILALALPGGRAVPDETAFGPSNFTILTKTYREETHLEMDSFEVRVNGEPRDQDIPDAILDITRRVSFSDEFTKVREGKVLDLTRTFDTLGSEVALMVDIGTTEEHTVIGASELEGAVVRFEWDEDDEEYLRTFEEGGTDEDDHLEALTIDADLVGFLPEGGVEVDDEWEVDPVHLGRVLAPSGDLRIFAEDLGDTPYNLLDREAMYGALQTALGEISEEWGGEIRATYLGSSEKDGELLGTIELEVEVSVEAAQLEGMQRTIDALGLDNSETYSDLTLEWTLSGRGELVWNLNEGHVHAFTLGAEVGVEARLAYTENFFGEELEIEGFYELSGETKVTLEVE